MKIKETLCLLIAAAVTISTISGCGTETKAAAETAARKTSVKTAESEEEVFTFVIDDTEQTDEITAVTTTKETIIAETTTEETTVETTTEETTVETTTEETTVETTTEETTVETTTETTTDAVTEAVIETTAETTAAKADKYDIEFFADDYFIGDSISTGFTLYGYFSKKQVFAKVGLNPDSAHTEVIDGHTSITKAAELKPKRIYIMLGTNGLAYMGITYMTNKLESLVKKLNEASPESEVYVISIPPVTKAHDSAGKETIAAVNEYNSMLKDMCSGSTAEFLDLCSELKDSEGFFSAKYAEADGLHFLGAAYVKMLSFIQESVG